ncbi:MAG: hypothetical protein JWL85_576 [Candidatus Saccharibacteria bacterium]|nr:hypothetical protein [Candidatus Saccharibacteria bacterium]
MSHSPEKEYSIEALVPYADGTWIIDASNTREWEVAHNLEFTVFNDADTGYVENYDEYMADYGPYDDRSKFIITVRNGELAGCLRLIHPDKNQEGNGFMSIQAALQPNEKGEKLEIAPEGRQALAAIDLDREVIEVGSISVHKKYRSIDQNDLQTTASSLYGAVAAYIKDYAAEQTGNSEPEKCFILAILDERFRRLFKRRYPGATNELGPAVEYMNSPTTPVLVDCISMLKADTVRAEAAKQRLGRVAIA